MPKTLEHFAPGFSSIDEVAEAHGPIWDATTLSKIADCPRKHEIRVEENLTKPSASAPMVAGIAVHEGLEYFYAHPTRTRATEEEAIQIMLDEWDRWGLDRTQVDPKYTHLTRDHLAKVMENYFKCWGTERIEIFKPISGLQLDDLCLDDVLAAKFKLTDDDAIILGESNLVMHFDVGDDELVLAGKPDLPVTKQDGSRWSMDHKTTSGYLSDYWAKKHEVSNKDRGYMAMLQSLLGKRLRGTVINGIYVGKYATNPDSTATKFHRYQFDFAPGHVTEALRNQLYWKKTVEFYRSEGYFPQGCGYGGCSHPDICRRDPETRDEVKRTDYEQSDRTFWDL